MSDTPKRAGSWLYIPDAPPQYMPPPADPPKPCAECLDGTVITATCDSCGERHCQTCDPCEPCAGCGELDCPGTHPGDPEPPDFEGMAERAEVYGADE